VSLATGSEVVSEAFRELFDAEFAFVCRALRRLGVREADLADVTQELFVSVHRNLDSLDVSRARRPWLYSFAMRYASNYRRLARHRAHDSIDEMTIPLATSDADIGARDLVLRALADLDFDRRTVLVMHDLEGFQASEIAEMTETLLNTVYSRLRVARADFRAAVERLEKDAGAK
jgi:RNA polymerase sigma-70 factor, ECF subfamily